MSVDGGEPQNVTLDDRSLGAGGQRVDITPTTGPSTVSLTIESVVVPPGTGEPLAAVGFAEVDAGLGPTVEVVRLPTDAIVALRDSPETRVVVRVHPAPHTPERSLARRSRADDAA